MRQRVDGVISRGVAIAMGGYADIAEYAMSDAEARRTAIPGTLTLTLRIGRTIRGAREQHCDPFEALIELLPQTVYSFGCILFDGKIVNVQRETRNGFALGRTSIRNPAGNAEMQLEFQNENLIARAGGVVRAIVPDLIACWTARSPNRSPRKRRDTGNGSGSWRSPCRRSCGHRRCRWSSVRRVRHE